ncbi:MAG: alpha/beta fold hydrolase [Geminicoccaceae bacterium]|nr:alpha/beta fold hydrolase [Geminicoccaceae bacterium]
MHEPSEPLGPAPERVAAAFRALTLALLEDPERLIAAHRGLRADVARLWERHARRLAGEAVDPLVRPAAGDRRFVDPLWSEEAAFDTIKQAHLLFARRLLDLARTVPGLDPAARRLVLFVARHHLDALSPANFPFTNPAVLEAARASGGATLARGLRRLAADRAAGRWPGAGAPAFRLGETVAATKGWVVFENGLLQLIQYAPTTAFVRETPLLVVPSWINKFYVLDLRPENSLVRWAVGEGFTVFAVSWVNPDGRHAARGFDDYLGALEEALDAVRRQTGAHGASLLGYCLGGTLAACLAAFLAARGLGGRVRGLGLLAAPLDFAEPGEVGVFVDAAEVDALERHMAAKGYLEAEAMQGLFRALRANDLIWPAAVDAYLLGRPPRSFDLLCWSADGTRLPARLHLFCLRGLYGQNLLARPGALEVEGTPIDLGRIGAPCFSLALKDDHLVPWASVHAGGRLLQERPTFVLGGSGHVAGVVNPPDARKYAYWTNPAEPPDAAGWLEGARRHPGSWWPFWRDWLLRHAGGASAPRDPERGPLPPIEPAPGRYVRMLAEDPPDGRDDLRGDPE